ncbi:MAG: FMN-dependent oxidoreductase (nitrilotriacetate monooxygenase family) [Acidimicrobiales bacterium]|jgi:FMN-dependent oxidoreductase (nitrilotriacetate monooxygenase family)
MTVGAFFKNTGHHIASWRHPRAQPDAGVNIEHYISSAQLAEQACFDFLFFADSVAIRDGPLENLSRQAQFTAYFEPTTLLAALATQTSKIGLVATMSTSYNDPYSVARRAASIDHLSHGRAGWNAVTSVLQGEARNFGRDEHFEKQERYERAAEFIEVVRGLWDSWDDDAFTYDRQRGRFFDPDRVHRLDHVGEHFKVAGPLNVPRCPQGHPVVFQAGSSETGRELAAASADGIFCAELDMDRAVDFCADLGNRLVAHGRTRDSVRILPGFTAVVGATEAEAKERAAELAALIQPEAGKYYLTQITGVDLQDVDPDDPFPDPTGVEKTGGIPENVRQMARTEGLTVRQLYERLAGSHGKLTMVGSASQIADEMQRWYDAAACDGFIITPSTMPGEFEDVVELLVPELKDRGLMRADYDGETLREHLGLARPTSRYSTATTSPETHP